MSETVLVRDIAARPDIVFDALVTAEDILSWWGPADFPALSASADPREGGAFKVRFRTSDGREHECSGEFLILARPKHLVMSWRWIHNGEPGEQGRTSRLEFKLRPTDTGTELTLIHAELCSEVSARSHHCGWAGALTKLLRRFPAT